MAERPAFFTVAPWGHRILTPALVRALPIRNPIRGFGFLTFVGLAAAGVILFLYLRRLGHGELLSVAAVAAFGLTRPVAETIRYQILVEPLTLLLLMLFLLALERHAGLGVLVLIATLGALSKEHFLLLLPLVFLVELRRGTARRALAVAAAVGAPALCVTLILRLWWTPYLAAPPIPPLSDLPALIAERLRAGIGAWGWSLVLSGLTPLALVGVWFRAARPFWVQSLYLLLVAVLPPLLNPFDFSAPDMHRLLLYAVPGVAPLALAAVDRALPHMSSPPPAAAHQAWTGRVAVLLTVGLLAAPLVFLDRYQRADLRGAADAPLVLATCRGTLAAAERAEEGETVAFDLSARPFREGQPPLYQLGRIRWYLFSGWGSDAHKRAGPARLQGERARLLIPSLTPGALEVSLQLDAPTAMRLEASVNGRPVGDAGSGRSRTAVARLRIPPHGRGTLASAICSRGTMSHGSADSRAHRPLHASGDRGRRRRAVRCATRTPAAKCCVSSTRPTRRWPCRCSRRSPPRRNDVSR